MKYQAKEATLMEIRAMSMRKLRAYCEMTDWQDEQAVDELREREADTEFDEEMDDTPSLQNCDDWGTGEGRWHGRM